VSHRKWEDKIPKELRAKLWKERAHVCGICGKPIEAIADMQVDHIKSVKDGGETVESNLQLSHAGCNNLKGSKSFFTIPRGAQDPIQKKNIKELTHRTFSDAMQMIKTARAFKKRVFSGRIKIAWYIWMDDYQYPFSTFRGYNTNELRDYLLRSGEVCLYAEKEIFTVPPSERRNFYFLSACPIADYKNSIQRIMP
jgi:hypothetical protein